MPRRGWWQRRPAQLSGDSSSAKQSSIEEYFRASSSLTWSDVPRWPPDVFCLCNLVLDHTEAYRFVVAPPSGRRWPPADDWREKVTFASRQWAAGELPDLV